MKVLAIDTTNYVLGIAIVDEVKVIGEYITNLKKNHSVRAMPAIDMLMRECDVVPSDLHKIVVAKGPGSYTGVRIGVTIAKTLAWTLNIPLVGVSSLEILAASSGRYFNGYVSPLFDARRGQIYTGLYRYDKGELTPALKDIIVLSELWAEQLKGYCEPILFVGNDLHLHRQAFEKTLTKQAVFAAVTEHNPRPGELAFLGMNKESEEVHTFTPNYVRMAEAEVKWLKKNRANN
ncbi:tRNA (adenosine(37)-N6)-threonylcarbamoyltransferase complex dimerization subunit type 1 TsaB [Bacillus aquiflavi]|uniref:tRNA (Adenosine(37)-N6)-threonylcarbamoyltransferase complex dimerization subunit type 1 TsaB n=1 Tax=Bacillus aquiflavi TaxID=2672567 RepID=A0A6B3W4U3_9BACI|nr:tRNA (adenosine(37)-N6)-threonylcarbamoyltransferase complex dimerization subunit type 1 TsaB [Bacillus aquiflavi]MBA4538594.1 tRNA (adenosine(37)-N6)-threonylcarbamoyltransferase complex dimerization subunit type 1 TsaB [Bacillus aquiflavi]NEY82956.1 tRNA (adenosine(37)-N6)-threonylcarbamoyltransferase complex dimerization subunit type 1 TsaB [Bacillus aquiflavi]